MLLLFRFLRVVLLGLIARRRPILDESVLHFRVMPTDIDFNLHLNDGRYMSFMGIGRADILVRSGLLRRALQKRWAPVVGGAIVRYRREIRTFKKMTLRSRVIGWDEKWVYFGHTIESEGSVRALAYVRGVLRSREGAVPTRTAMESMGWSAESPLLPGTVRNWPELG